MIANSRARDLYETCVRLSVSRMSRPESVTQDELMRVILLLCDIFKTCVQYGVEPESNRETSESNFLPDSYAPGEEKQGKV